MRGRSGAVLVTLVAALHAASFLGTGPLDDDFIVFRYARHWVEGLGPVYEAGERVEGFTVPLWLMLLALGMLARLPPEAVSVGVGLLSAVATAWVLAAAWRGRSEGSRDALPVPALLLAASPAVAYHAVAGLGTTLLGLLLALWLAGALRAARRGEPPVGAAVALGLAGLLRAEAVLFAVPWIALTTARRRGYVPLLSLVPVAGWTLFRLGYYGGLLPVTYDVKKLPLAVDALYGLDYLLYSSAQTGLVLFVAFAVVAAVRERGRLAAPVRAGAAGVVLHTAYVVYVGGDYVELARFHAPVLPVAMWLACRGGERAIAPRRRDVAAALVVLGVVLPQWTQLVRGELEGVSVELHDRWRAVGEHLARVLPPDASLALSPIGIIGYVTDRPIVDLLGVTNTAIQRVPYDPSIHLKGHHRHDGSWAIAQEPDLVILGNAAYGLDASGRPHFDVLPWERSVWESPAFEREYVPMRMEVPGSDPLHFFLRRGSAEPAGAERLP